MTNIKAITMLSKVQKKLSNQSSDKQIAILETVQPPAEMDALAAQILASTLRSLGLFSNGVSKFTQLLLDKQPASFFERWLNSSIQYLQDQKLLSHELTLKPDLRTLDDLWSEWKNKKSEWATNSNLIAQINLLDVCLKSLPTILSGKQPATDFMFPNSSMELVEGIYKGNVQADYLNGVLGETLKACIEERLQADNGCKIRLLEIGAGTGGTTAKILPMLKGFGDTIAEYCYTDLSKAFLMHAEEHYQPEFPALTTAIFDVSKPLVSQSIVADKYDFIIATNVLHATPNIRETLRNSKAVLKNQGVLLINEMSTWTLFTHLTFGLLEGWWLYEDTALRLPGSPGLTPQKWKEVMEEVGFESVFFPAEKVHRLGHQVVAASSDGLIRQRYSKQSKIISDKKVAIPEVVKPVKTIKSSVDTGESLRDKSISFFQELVAKTLKMNPQQIEPNQPFEKYGLDSILVVQLTNQFRKVFPDITSTLFFEERTIEGLVKYFIENKKEALMALLSSTTTTDESKQISPVVNNNIVLKEQEVSQDKRFSRVSRKSNQASFQVMSVTNTVANPHVIDVAIIGLSGRYPQSNNLSEFWINLSKGTNCITEIPKNRWNWEEYFDEEKGKLGKMYTKWGGFLKDIDKFDPLFFKIAPKEAERMDPQERLFLESCYHAIEDAGYTPATLGSIEKIGVFAGVMNARYTSQPLHYSVANRVSYLFNFQGPSMAVDTACSSSLTAIHLALDSIYSGLSECAIAGGVNLIIDPVHYLELTAMTMLSPGNQCKAFGNAADGFIDAEGVGAVVLKPLKQAEQDGDHIYGIIKGSAVNAGGKTNGYTVPNPKAQSAVIAKALKRANLVAEQISYVEAHGTGTALGDPIEVAALARAFKETSDKKQFCSIGSLKSNIGHCESASGIAGLTKVLLQLKHEQLVPSIHADVENPEIDFSQTPFVHQKSLAKWQRPSQKINGIIQEIPRIAGISSFGAGGANAHIIVQEYIQPVRYFTAVNTTNVKVMIPLSARTAEQLQQKVCDLFNFIRATQTGEQVASQKTIDVSALAYTLQVGRDAMEERLGFIVNSVDQLVEKLQLYINGEQDIENVYRGQVKPNKDTVSQFNADADLQETVNKWIDQKKLSRLLDWWVKGLQLDWNKLYGEEKPGRISLPLYPFAKERYWVDATMKDQFVVTGKATTVLHPLLHTNTSDLLQQSYNSTFSGEEFFIKDYHVRIGDGLKQKILPVVAYFEMARVAMEKAMPLTQESILELHNIVWGKPIFVTGNKQVTIAVIAKGIDQLDFEIYSQDNGEEIIHCQGQAIFNHQPVSVRLEIAQLKTQMQKDKLDSSSLYNGILTDLGIQYGHTYQGITVIYKGDDQLLAELRLPSISESNMDGYVLHPSIMESAFQASISLIVDLTKYSNQTSRPFALESICIISACPKDMYAWARYSNDHQAGDKITKLDVDLCDQQGNVCVQMRGISYQHESINVIEQVSDHETSAVTTFAPRKISLSTITSEKISFSTPQVQTFKKEELKKPTGISLVASNAFQSEKLEERVLSKSFVTLSNVPIEPSHSKSTLSTPSSVSLYDYGDGIFTIQIAATASNNELSKELIEQLLQALETVRQESTIKVLTISGMEGCFLRGGRKQFNEAVEQKLFKAIVSFPYPAIAVMQGDAIGAGFLVGALCDFMICSQEGRYYYTNMQEGIYPTAGEDLLFRERFGESCTTDFLYLSTDSTGKQLQAKGWTCPILPQEQVAAHAQALASNLANKSQDSLRLLKQHLTRKLAPQVDELRVADPVTSDSTSGKAKADGVIASPSKHIQMETHAGNVLLIRILEAKKAHGTKALAADLKNIFTQINNASQYKSIVLASDHPDFLSESATVNEVLELQRLILESTIPIIAVLDSNANGIGWFISQFCDASIYHDKGNYCATSILQSSELAKQAGMIFSHRFGDYLGKEILLTGNNYSGIELGQRIGSLQVVEKSQVLTKALELADYWAKLPMETIVFWKKRIALGIQQEIDQLPVWVESEEKEYEPLLIAPSPIELKNKVVSAIAHPEGILVVKLEDREVKNMFSDTLVEGIIEVFEHISQVPYKVVILTGYDTYFASGGTKEGLLAIQEGKAKFTDTKIYQLAMECKVPVIAAMQGHGIGGGWSLGMFADLILFSEESHYLSPYMNFGFTPGAGATFIFPYVMGYDLARETLLTAREYTGIDLKNRGLRISVLPREQVNPVAFDLAKKIAQKKRGGLIALKHQLTQHVHSQVEETYKLELSMHEKTFVGQSEALKRINTSFIQGHTDLQSTTSLSEKTISSSSLLDTSSVSAISIPDVDVLPAVTASIKKLLAQELHLQEQDIDENTQFVDLGLDSITGVTLIRQINEKYKTSIEATKVYSYPTLTQLSRYVKEEAAKKRALLNKLVIPAEPQNEITINESSSWRNKTTLGINPDTSFASVVSVPDVDVLPAVTASIKKLLAQELHLQEQDIDENTQFVDLGLDSITGVTLIRQINEKYKTSIEATKVYSYPTLTQLSRYVKEEAVKKGTLINKQVIPAKPQNKISSEFFIKELSSWRNKTSLKINPSAYSAYQSQSIAVVGMAGKFPQASNLEEFWQNIAQGKNCISQISQNRWDINTYYHEGKPVPGKTNCKWMGALEEYDLFDPLFFNISPTEAENMDPQQRVFLQACWHSIESSGYNPKSLSGTKCGVFVGCGVGDYHKLSPKHQLSAQGFTGAASSILAARISYYLNLQGPCLSIDTACSSSLIAIASACDSLILGNSDIALAGGVNVLAGPSIHIMSSQTGMLSTDGRCFTFDNRANGFVPGEGVGVVMLKRLADAEKDHDIILGVIEGWGANQDGKTNGITAPNAESQTRLEQEVYDKYHIDPDSIQLIENHGTGTKLGDPIEVEALKEAFKKYTQKKNYCALGSVKSNVGHCLSAAGVAGFIKLLLALKHKQLPPTINFDKLNEHIDLKESPFYINSQLQKWELKDALRRQAAISSFGFSGTNAHIVLAEHLPSKVVKPIAQNTKFIIPLSARTAKQLKQKVRDLLDFICREEESIDLAGLAYTLQVGRDAMEERLSFMVSSINQLTVKLQSYLDGEQGIEDSYQGQVKRNKEGLNIINQDEETKEVIISKWINQRKLSKLMELWVKGLEFDWNRLYEEVKPQRICIPVYPFAKERYWLESVETEITSKKLISSSVLHPLLHNNTSNFSQQSYSSTFSGEEFFLKDHQVNGQKILPGVAYLEMARKAITHAIGEDANGSIQLSNIVWLKPIVVNDAPKKVDINLYPEDDGQIAYEITSIEQPHQEPVIHSQGRAIFNTSAQNGLVDFTKLKSRICKRQISQKNCYDILKTMGMEYGSGHQGLVEVNIGEHEVLAKLNLPASVLETKDLYFLHPSLIDSAIQAAIGLQDDSPSKLALPFALKQLEIFSPCTQSMWSWVRYAEGEKPSDKVQTLDIDVFDDAGNVCVKMRGFSSRVLENNVLESTTNQVGTLLLKPVWQKRVTEKLVEVINYAERRIFVCGLASVKNALQKMMPEVVFTEFKPTEGSLTNQFQEDALQLFETLQTFQKKRNNDKILIQVLVSDRDQCGVYSALSGMLKTAHLENSRIVGQVIVVQDSLSAENLFSILQENSLYEEDSLIRYEHNQRYVNSMVEVISSIEYQNPWRKDGVYLITGGAGALGQIFAQTIAESIGKVTLILTDRSVLSKEKQQQIEKLQAFGARVDYHQVDVADGQAVKYLMEAIEKEFGKLTGILHCAGINNDNLIVKKTVEEFKIVLAPKVNGTFNLDEASQTLPIEYFILFSSIAGNQGNVGQVDYAVANAFMDAYAYYRNGLVAKQLRHGKTISINWPLWHGGGMFLDAATEKLMHAKTGMIKMQKESGIHAFNQCLSIEASQIMVMEGQLSRMRQYLFAYEKKVQSHKLSPIVEQQQGKIDIDNLISKIQNALLQKVAKFLKIRIDDLDVNTELPEFGFDSISMTELINQLNQDYKLELTPTVFFDYPTLSAFANYLAKAHKEIFVNLFSLQVQVKKQEQHQIEIDIDFLTSKIQNALLQKVAKFLKIRIDDLDVNTELPEFGFDSISMTELINQLNQDYKLELTPTVFFDYPTLSAFANYLAKAHKEIFVNLFSLQVQVKKQDVSFVEVDKAEEKDTDLFLAISNKPKQSHRFIKTIAPESRLIDPIAIIGVSGKFPQAETLEDFWKNLKEGKDCISEIPKMRWDWQAIYGDPKTEVNKTNIKWGGFIDGIDEFDPLFFGISPREAQHMDPQQRLIMTYIWKVIEDAGYSSESLSDTQTGIFIGTFEGGYSELLTRAKAAIKGYSSTGKVPSMGPNRMSYFLNLHGPSEAIETACSSSLVAIHRAIEAIEMGDCEMAIVGGVNTILKPFEHISFGNAGMLSEDGRCKTFSDRANGYVRGEGVGMLFLKKLSAAERDGDSIYAIIRGSAENHGGRANSLTAPNPIAQASLLKAAYKKAAIDPRTVGYIEAHGTGTELGDPIEVNALKNAFKDLYNETGGTQMAQVHCGLGSVKSNIGHLELAAGIAGVIKVLLQFKHKTRVKTLHCDFINPYIDLKNSPFYIVQENDHWHRIKDQQGSELPRRAGVSSFGFGGANAHVVLEEYIVKESEHKLQANDNYLIILSAKTETSLKEAARNLKKYLETNEEANLSSIAYTLQVGRDVMEERIALIIQSREELINKLNDFLDGKETIDLFYRGQIKRNKGVLIEFAIDEEIEKAIETWIVKGKYEKLLSFWVKGLVIDWRKLYGENKPKRINLPSYTFEKERYWIDTEQIENTDVKPAILHSLLHCNTSDFIQQSYKSTFSSEEFFLKDHQVQGQRILPGVAYLEMARVAISLASQIQLESTTLELHNIVWLKPLVVEEYKDVSIVLAENFKGNSSIDQIDYEIYSQDNEEEIIHCQGQAILSQRTTTDMLDLEKLKGQMGCKTINGTDLYAIFTQIGFNYGQAFQGVKTIFIGEEELLAQLQLPPIIEGKSEYNDFLLHPSLMDSALQSSFGLIADLNHIPSKPFVPFALEHIRIISACTSEMFSWVRYSPGSKPNDKLIKFDIDLCDQQGNICVQMQGFSFRILEGEVKSSHQKTNSDSLFDDSYYQKLIEKVLKNEISVDEAVELA